MMDKMEKMIRRYHLLPLGLLACATVAYDIVSQAAQSAAVALDLAGHPGRVTAKLYESLPTIETFWFAGLLAALALLAILCQRGAQEGQEAPLAKAGRYVTLAATTLCLGYMFLFGTAALDMQTRCLQYMARPVEIYDIGLEQLAAPAALGEGGNAMVYIKREGCPACPATTALLTGLARDRGAVFYQYNTIHDREGNAQALADVLEGYGVTEVPAVLVLRSGQPAAVLYQDDMESGVLESWLVP